VTLATDSLIAFVNERPVRVPPTATCHDAVRVLAPDLADAVSAGRGYLTDGRGIRIAPETPVTAGAIIRVVVSARQAREHDADA
jgi:hypothetical protein